MAIHLNPRLKRNVHLLFKDFCENNTLHGLRYFTVRVRHWSERLWWVLAVALSLWLSFSMIHTFWVEWQNNPATMITTNGMNPISKIPFPTVTICPETKIVRDNFDIFSKHDSTDRLLSNISHTDKLRLSSLAQLCYRLISVVPSIDFAEDDIFNVIEEFAPTVEQMALSCSWKGAIINCSEYLKPVLTKYGLCFAFNGLNSRDIYTDKMAPGAMISTSNPNVSHWSMESGYAREFGKEEYPIRVNDSDQMSTLEINLAYDERNEIDFCPISHNGFNVFLSPPFDQTTLLQRSIGLPLSQDTHILFAPELTTTSNGLRKYSPIQRKCFFQSERQLRFFKTYSANNCEMECWANMMNERAGCVHFLMPRDGDTKICGTENIGYFYTLAMTISSMRLECNCLPACTSLNYDFEIEQFPLNVIQGEKLSERQQQARLRITIENHKVKTTERIEAVTVAGFLAMCGGILGLFMGFSALSSIELIYYPFLRSFWKIRRMNGEKDKEQSEKREKSDIPSEKAVDSKNRDKKKDRLRSFLIEYCDNSNIHGVRYFSERKLHRSERCYWMISCVASLSLCCWMTYNVWVQWQSSPVAIRFAKENDSRLMIPLPTVTICTEVKTTKQEFDPTFAFNNLSNLSDTEIQRLTALTDVCPISLHLTAFENKFANELTYDAFHYYATRFDEHLTSCLWNDSTRSFSCFTGMTPILTDEGTCFTFNALNSHDMYTNEMAPGMMIVTGNRNVSHWDLENGYDFDFHKYEYPARLTHLKGFSNSFRYRSFYKRDMHPCNYFDGEFNLILTPPGEVMKISRNSFRIHSENINLISFGTKVMKTSDGLRSYTPSQRQCFYQSERRLRFFKIYTQANCEEECLANFTSIECGCVHFFMPRDNKTKVCAGASFACLETAKRNLLTENTGLTFHSECDCLPACVSMEYKANIDRFPFVYEKSDDPKWNDKRYKSGLIVLNFDESEICDRVESLTVIDFLAMCGGLLGVFLGISVLSLIEIIYFITIRLFWTIWHWKSVNSVVPLKQESFEMITVEDNDE